MICAQPSEKKEENPPNSKTVHPACPLPLLQQMSKEATARKEMTKEEKKRKYVIQGLVEKKKKVRLESKKAVASS